MRIVVQQLNSKIKSQNIILGYTKKTLILVYEKIVIMDGVENKNALSELI